MCESGQKGEEGQSGKGFRRETWAEEVTRLQREIAERQARLHFLVAGDPTQEVVSGYMTPEEIAASKARIGG